ncbi:MAG: heavy metal translocating P-type ATPase [Hyphomicrobiaceae bacterium]|nr:heavy metal translocating P-type ATPase [Hyphomicrobiaceae bacterium]
MGEGTAARDWSAFATPDEVSGREGVCRLELAVDGITCAACMGDIERGLMSLSGVERARLNLSTHRLSVAYDAAALPAEAVVGRVEALGYKAFPFDPARRDDSEREETKELLRSLAVAGFAMMNVMLLSVSVWSGNATDITAGTRDFLHWVSALIALPAGAYAGRPFFRSAWRALRAGRMAMDVPISLGVILTLALSLAETIRGGEEAYFDSAVMLLFFLLVGRYAERAMRRRTRAEAENLAALRAESATRIDPDGRERIVPLSEIRAGDRLVVAPGARIPVDATVESGVSEIDKSLVTGESDPERIEPGASVYGGTLNGSGALVVVASAAADKSLLATVERLMEGAMEARSQRLDLADRAARLYAPVVHSTAALTLLGWVLAGAGWHQSIVIAVSALIITCPCALGLAVPAVQVVAAGALFRSRVLLTNGSALERLAEVDMVVFDKTGTLTDPEPTALNLGDMPDDLLALAGALARRSRHPLAQALAGAGTLSAENVVEHPGEGLEGNVEGRKLRIGSPVFCAAESEAEAVLSRHPGASVIAVHADGMAPAVAAIVQALKPDAAETIAALKARGLEIAIFSGDRPGAVAAVADTLQIADRRAGLGPEAKVAALHALADDGRKVLMVGDGLNDAAALAAAHVSLSPVSGVALARAAADAVFMGNRLAPVIATLDVARSARARMTENLGFSALYNIVAIPVAVSGHVTPLIAALAMSASSIIVTLNALRARA